MSAEMPLASTDILPAPSTRILWPLAVSRMVGSPDWKRIPLFCAAVVFMMVRVQPVSGVAWILDLFPLLLVSQSRSFEVPASERSVLASWIAVSSSSSSAFPIVAVLALSLLLVVVPLSALDLQILARCPVLLHFVHFSVSLFFLHSIDLWPISPQA